MPKVILTGQSNGASNWDAIEDKPNFATVATSGRYYDLSDRPEVLEVDDIADWAKQPTKPSYNYQEIQNLTQATVLYALKSACGHKAMYARNNVVSGPRLRDIQFTNTSLTAGSSALPRGTIYLQYE